MGGLGRLVKTSVDPIPIVHPHHHQSMKDRVPQLLRVGQTELFGGPTVIGPELVSFVQLEEGVVLPTKLPLKLGMALLSWEN